MQAYQNLQQNTTMLDLHYILAQQNVLHAAQGRPCRRGLCCGAGRGGRPRSRSTSGSCKAGCQLGGSGLRCRVQLQQRCAGFGALRRAADAAGAPGLAGGAAAAISGPWNPVRGFNRVRRHAQAR